MTSIINCFKGIVMGAGMILPGVSGGVIAVIFGLYQDMVDAVLHFFRDVKKNLLFLVPIGIGGLAGIAIFGRVLKILFNHYPVQTQYAFIGLILGGIPAIFNKVKGKAFRKSHTVYGVITFAVSCAGVLFIKPAANGTDISLLGLFISGVLVAFGSIVPGVSSSLLLMLMGSYQYYLDMIASLTSHPTIALVLSFTPIILGGAVGGLVILKLVDLIMKKYTSQSYCAIVGFVLGSIAGILPEWSTIPDFLGGLVFLVFMFIISYRFSAKEKTV